MDQVCVLLHGIKCDPASRLWNEEFSACYQSTTKTWLIPRKYGYVSGFSVWSSAYRRKQIVDHENLAFVGNPGKTSGLVENISGAKLSGVGHSLGGYILTALLFRGSVKFHKLALLWSSSAEDFDWYAVQDCFDKIRVYWSASDEILRTSQPHEAANEPSQLRLGLLGKAGPTILHPHVEAIKSDWLHNQFMDKTDEADKMVRDMFHWIDN